MNNLDAVRETIKKINPRPDADESGQPTQMPSKVPSQPLDDERNELEHNLPKGNAGY